jgi:tripartite-type tricarboxylate transporter receptor subunit TctC
MGLKVRSIFALLCGFLAIMGIVASPAAAVDWPTRPVKWILPLGPGSGTDLCARMIADRISKRWGQPVIVENRPGGDGIVAINGFVAAHDDHVLLFSPSASFTAHPYLHDKLPYRPADLVPITRVSSSVVTIAVPVGMPVNSLPELVAMARTQPGKLNWAGVTGALDFMFAGWLKNEKLAITKVPYRNPVDAAKDLAAGRVQVYEAALAIVLPQLQSGKIKLLAVTNVQRAPSQPQIPTVKEAGFPALTLDGLVGLFGHPGMPLELRRRITSDIRAVVDTTVKDRLTIMGQLLTIGGPEEFARSIDDQRAKIAEFAAALGVKPMQ